MRILPLAVMALLFLGVSCFVPATHATGFSLPNYTEGNWTSYSMLSAFNYSDTRVENLVWISVSNQGVISLQTSDGSFFATINGTNGQTLLNSSDLNGIPFLNSEIPTSAEGSYIVIQNTTLVSPSTYIFYVVKGGTQLLSLPLSGTNNDQNIGTAFAISPDGRFVVGAALGGYFGDILYPFIVWEGVGVPALKLPPAVACPSGQFWNGIACAVVPKGGGPSSCDPSLGYVCTVTTASVSTTVTTTGGGPTPPPPVAYPLTALVLAIVVSGLFVFRRVRGQNTPRALLGSGGMGRNFKNRIKRAFS